MRQKEGVTIPQPLDHPAADSARANSDKTRSRDDWIRAAFDVLAAEGVSGLRIERVAQRLGVTKGSFYWHFRDRDDWIGAVLARWREGRIRDIEKQTQCAPGEEAAQLAHVIEVYSSSRNPRGVLIELAMREWAKRDERVAAIVRDVDAVRLAQAARLFQGLGLDETTAQARAALLYAYVFGMSLLLLPHSGGALEALRAQIAPWIVPEAIKR